MTLLFDFEVDNPNPVEIKTSGYGYDFKLNGSSLLSGTQENKSVVGSKKSSSVKVPVTFRFADMYRSLSSIGNQDSTSFELDTEILFDLPVLGETKLPVKAAGYLPVVKMPDINYGGFRVKNASLTSVEVEFNVNVNNPNYFGLNLNKLDYAIDINGASLVESSLNNKLSVKGKSNSTLAIPVKIDLAKVGMNTLQSILTGKPFDYKVRGNGLFDVDLPYFKQNEMLPFEMMGNISIR